MRLACLRGLIVLGAFLLVFTQYGCNTAPNGGIPIYVRADSAKVIGGVGSNKITDIWVQAGSSNLGVYQMPVRFPILQQGNIFFVISPGIKDNGLYNTRAKYPFLAPDTFTLAQTKLDSLYYIHPTFSYKTGAITSYQEDFEAGLTFDNKMIRTTDPLDSIKYGFGCGKIVLNPTDTIKEAYMTNYVPIQSAGLEVYLEMDYKCNNSFEVGLIGDDPISGPQYMPVITLYKNMYPDKVSHWEKIYINLSSTVGSSSLTRFKVYFNVTNAFDTTASVHSTAKVYVDNLRILHF